LLPNGQVLVAGGDGSSVRILSSAELYDPATGTWTNASSLTTNRAGHTATLLPNGTVLVAGGFNLINGCGNLLSSAELYNPATGTWTATGSLTTARDGHTATLLPNGKVLVAVGNGLSGVLSSAELYDVGLGFTNSWQPQIATITSPLSLGDSMVLTGSQFRGISEGSGGNTQSSPADYPVVQLRRLDNEQTVFLLTTNWSTNSFTSLPVWNFPPGYALATMFVNGIQSTSSVVNISVPIPTAPALTGVQALTNGSFQFAFTNSVGALFGVLTTTNLALPLSNWTALGGVVEISPGQFQFTDPQATNNLQRFYRSYSP
jgi:choline dehydrogenase-like flavoprotein